jgi:cold shock CspA family protein
MKDPLRTFKACSQGCIKLSEQIRPLRLQLKKMEEAFLHLSKLRLKADKQLNEGKVIKLPTCKQQSGHKGTQTLAPKLMEALQMMNKLQELQAKLEQLERKQR